MVVNCKISFPYQDFCDFHGLMKHYVKNYWRLYTLRSTNSLLLKMAIEMVGLPIKNGDLLYSYVSYLQLIYSWFTHSKWINMVDLSIVFSMIFDVYQGLKSHFFVQPPSRIPGHPKPLRQPPVKSRPSQTQPLLENLRPGSKRHGGLGGTDKIWYK